MTIKYRQMRLIVVVLAACGVWACNTIDTSGTGALMEPHTLDHGPEATRTDYTPPEASGLRALRPYPGPRDVCQVVGENDLTIDFLDHTATLIACPKHERGAMANRLAEGGQIMGHARHWTLISIPTD